MSKEEKVIKYYVLCNKLKNVIRTGWKVWNVKRERLESIAEHVYGTQMLALAMWDTYNYDIDIFKVAFMLAIHEIGETVIGDITQFEKSKEEKAKLEHDAVNEILRDFDSNMIEQLFLEFDEGKTKEALFAFQCDKLEWDLQAKLYGEEDCVDLNDQERNKVKNNKIVKRLLDEGNTWEEMCLKFGQEVYPYDENFRAVSNYALTHRISNKKSFKERKQEYFDKLTKCFDMIVPILKSKFDIIEYCKIMNPSNEKELTFANLEITYDCDFVTLINDATKNNIKQVSQKDNNFIKLLLEYYDCVFISKTNNKPSLLKKAQNDPKYFANIYYDMMILVLNKKDMLNIALNSLKLNETDLTKILVLLDKAEAEITSALEHNQLLSGKEFVNEFHRRCENGRIDKNISYVETPCGLIKTLFPNNK